MHIRYVDLFCGIGGMRLGVESALANRRVNGKCVFSCDIDENARRAYHANFGETPEGDITQIPAEFIPDHDLLLAGFPCQPFSIIGSSKGFEDARGTLFFDIARILERKRPAAFILENVKRLAGHDNGRTLSRILETLDALEYKHTHRILNALDFGLPQKRERIFIVGFAGDVNFHWPLSPVPMRSLSEILEENVPQRYYASQLIREKRAQYCDSSNEPLIWHENKSGHVSSHPYSCALRAGASYNYLLVNGERRLTPRELLRLQGFPDSFKIVCSDFQTRKQAGNSVPAPIIQAITERLLDAVGWDDPVLLPNEGAAQ